MSLPALTVLLPFAASLWGLFRLALAGEKKFLVVALLAASAALAIYLFWAWTFRDGMEVVANFTHGGAAWGKVLSASRIPIIVWGAVAAISFVTYKVRSDAVA